MWITAMLVWALQDKDVLNDGDGQFEPPVVTEEDIRVMSFLSTQPISPDMPQVPLSEFKDQLQAYTGLNFAFSGIEDTELSVSVQLTDVTVEAALNLALAPADLSWYVENGVVLIVPASVVDTRTVLRFYPVETYAGFGSEVSAVQLEEAIQNLTLFRDEGHSVGRSGSMLVVRTTLKGHREVFELLKSFEAILTGRRLQLNIEVFFIAVKESTLRDIRWGANRIKPEAFAELIVKAESGGDEAAMVSAGEVVCFDGQLASAFGGTERPAQEGEKSGVRDGTQIQAKPVLAEEGAVVFVELSAVYGERLAEGEGMRVYQVGTTVRAPRDAYVNAGSVSEIGGSGRRVIAVVRASVVE